MLMKSKETLLKVAASALFGLAVFLFFRIAYPYHLHFQEQCQMFLFSSDYLFDVVSMPGGLSDYIGRFLTQFFYQAAFGAGIIALLSVGVQLLTFSACGRRTLMEYALSFLPSCALVISMCDENSLLSPFIAIISGLSFIFLLSRSTKRSFRYALIIALGILLYLMGGGLAALVFSVAALCREKDWRLAIACVAAAAASAFISAYLTALPFQRLMFGTHYYRYHNVTPLWPWTSALLLSALLLADTFGRYAASNRRWPAVVTLLAVFALSATGVAMLRDSTKEEMMKYAFFTRMQLWNRIIRCAAEKSPDTPVTVSCLNLALAMTGQMGEHMFEFFQNGTEGLLPSHQRDHFSPLPASDICWHLGFVNTSQRFIFDAQEVIPDFQKSAVCYRRMVEASIVTGAYDVARKYLEPLKHTLFYRKWALENEILLDNPELIESHPVYGRQRELVLKEKDFFFSDYEMDSMLGLHFVENRSNKAAMQYLLAWTLLNRNLPRFFECLQLYDGKLPKSYQEGAILYWAETHDSPEGMPSYITKGVYDRFVSFVSDYRSGNRQLVKKKYGDTYWLYYYGNN